MPNIVQGNSKDTFFVGTDLGYSYPKRLNLRPDSPLHKKIIEKVMRMADDSYSVMSRRHPKWNDIDNTLKVYIPKDEYEKKLKVKDSRRPTSIVVPYSYAVLETIMAYMTKAFLTDTIFSYDGVSAEDTIPAKLLELVVNQQVRRFKSALEIHTSLRDGFSYGIGASAVVWSERWGMKPQLREVRQFSSTGLPIQPIRTRENVEALLFEGNEVVAIDPYRFLPDPNVSIHNFQSGEFVGWIEFKSYYKLLADEQSDGMMFNVKYLKSQGGIERTSRYTTDASSRIVKKDETRTPNTTNYVTLINMYVTLIPKDWGLPGTLQGNDDGEYPEIWLFTIANESLVLKAQPLNLNHGQYPIATVAPDFDGYSITPLARLELVDGLQTTLNWMFNSHVANVRKAINDMLIVDPSLVNMEDLRDPEPGKLIRLRRAAWGRSVKDAVQQLQVMDITRGNMDDAQRIMAFMQQSSAATDSTMGIIQRQGERVSASEFNGTMQMAVSRLDHMARLVSEQYLTDVAYFHAVHTQQLMSQEIFVKAVGEWPDILESEFQRAGFKYGDKVNVGPFDILADFDIQFKDGSTLSSDANSNQFWINFFNVVAQQPVLAQNFDIVRIFKHVARLNGAKNVNDFIAKGGNVNVEQAPDQAVAEEADKGNLIDISQYLQ